VLVNSIFRFPPQMDVLHTPELLEIGGLPFVSRSKSRQGRGAEVLPESRRHLRPPDHLATNRCWRLCGRRADETGRAGQAGREEEKNLCCGGDASRDAASAESTCAHVVIGDWLLRSPGMLDSGEDLSHVRHYYAERMCTTASVWSLSAAAIPPPNRRWRCFAPAPM